VPAPPTHHAITHANARGAADEVPWRHMPPDCPAGAAPVILDDLSLSIEREPVSGAWDLPDSTAVWVGRLRRIGTARLKAWGLSALVDDTQLLISALVTNGFRYGTGTQIGFRLVITADRVVMEVDDGSADRPEVHRPGLDEERGRGVLLISTLAAAWGVSVDGTRTWCVLKTTKPERDKPMSRCAGGSPFLTRTAIAPATDDRRADCCPRRPQ
jgi:hypothetical protein